MIAPDKSGAGWECRILFDADLQSSDVSNSVQLVQIDDAGDEWFAEGPGGSGAGTLEVTLGASAPDDVGDDALNAAVAAIRDAVGGDERRGLLLVASTGVTTFADPDDH